MWIRKQAYNLLLIHLQIIHYLVDNITKTNYKNHSFVRHKLLSEDIDCDIAVRTV
jgi:hypothetical protein